MTDDRARAGALERRQEVVDILAGGIFQMLLNGEVASGKISSRAARTSAQLRVVGERVVSENPYIIELKLDPAWVNQRRRRAARVKGKGPQPPSRRHAPRIARMLATAHCFEGLLRRGAVMSFAEIAAAKRITRARVSQIMDLLLLAPEIQEEILFLPRPRGRGPEISERQVRQIVRTPIWSQQRRLWEDLRGRQLVRLCFDASVAREAKARRWGTDRHVRRVRGGVQVAMMATPSPTFIAWVLSFGDKAEVLEPASLREQVAAELDRARARYRPSVG